MTFDLFGMFVNLRVIYGKSFSYVKVISQNSGTREQENAAFPAQSTIIYGHRRPAPVTELWSALCTCLRRVSSAWTRASSEVTRPGATYLLPGNNVGQSLVEIEFTYT